jgi:TRAP transporter TAXI family solute receptor
VIARVWHDRRVARTGVSTRTGVLVLVLAALCGLLSACGPDFSGLRLRIAAGSNDGVYYQLAQPLASAWAGQLGINRPEVLQTRGSPDNLALLQAGKAEVAFSAADVAANTVPAAGQPKLAALARIYDDYLHIVVRADSPITSVSTLRDRKVAIGPPESGVEVIGKQLIKTAGLEGTVNLQSLSLSDSLDALARKDIDAFFWSGGLPTKAISTLNAKVPLRLLDIAGEMPAMRKANPVYRSATIPASTYELGGGPVATLAVPNFLVVSSAMPDDVAEALVSGLFSARPDLAKANRAALSIDVRPAIETTPLALHPGALRYYRSLKP